MFKFALHLSRYATGPGGEMVDTLVSGASASRHVGSTPILGTIFYEKKVTRLSYLLLFIGIIDKNGW